MIVEPTAGNNTISFSASLREQCLSIAGLRSTVPHTLRISALEALLGGRAESLQQSIIHEWQQVAIISKISGQSVKANSMYSSSMSNEAMLDHKLSGDKPEYHGVPLVDDVEVRSSRPLDISDIWA